MGLSTANAITTSPRCDEPSTLRKRPLGWGSLDPGSCDAACLARDEVALGFDKERGIFFPSYPSADTASPYPRVGREEYAEPPTRAGGVTNNLCRPKDLQGLMTSRVWATGGCACGAAEALCGDWSELSCMRKGFARKLHLRVKVEGKGPSAGALPRLNLGWPHDDPV